MPNIGLNIQAVSVQGVLLQVGNGGSPETFVTVSNVTKLTFPNKVTMVKTTNVSNIWMTQIPTTLEIGDLQLDVFWVMEDPTINSQSPYGLRYIFEQRLKKDWQIIYPDGNSSTDAFQAYVSQFAITGQVNGVFTATVTLSGTGQPSLV